MKWYVVLAILIFSNGRLSGNQPTVYYVNPEAADNGNGSFENPWNSINQVNAHEFKDGDSLYFRAGTVLYLGQRLTIRWHGSDGNRVIIGAYYGKNLFGLGGASRPVLDGSNWVASLPHQGLIHYAGRGYVTIQDLHVRKSPSVGIKVFHPPGDRTVNNIVRNCMVIDSGEQGILLERSSFGLIENNIVSGTSLVQVMTAQGVPKYAGASIEIGSHGNEDFGLNNVVRGNIISRSSESLGIYKGARHTIVENNVIYDFVGVGIYAANARDGIIRQNLVYQVGDQYASIHPRFPEGRSRSGRRTMIHIDCEGHVPAIIKVTGGWEIYDNFVAGGKYGIAISTRCEEFGNKNNKIYNNRVADCMENFRINNDNEFWVDNYIEENYSFIFTNGFVHANKYSPQGITWRGNHYNTPPDITGNAGNSAILNQISLQKTSGWQDLQPGQVDKSFFNFTDEAAQLKKILNFRIIFDNPLNN